MDGEKSFDFFLGRSMRWNAYGCKAGQLGKQKMRGKFEGCCQIVVDKFRR